MILNQIYRRLYYRPFQCRLFSSKDDSRLLLCTALFDSLMRDSKSEKPLESGASRYWELLDESKYSCIGALGPIELEKCSDLSKKIRDLIDFGNASYDKLHVDISRCPNILAERVLASFPSRQFDRRALQIIRLSYDYYEDKTKGQLDCLIASNYICKRLKEVGQFSFYSGNALKNADNEILFHALKNIDHDKVQGLHASISSKNGYCKIDYLKANDIGVIYTDADFESKMLESILRVK